MPFDYQPMKTKEQLIADPQKLLDDIKAYFDYCDKTREERELKNGDLRVREVTPSILGLAQWLHCHRNTLTRLIDDNDETIPKDNSLLDAQNAVRGILAYAKQEMILRLSARAINGDAEDRVSQAMLARYGEIGEDKANVSLNITVAGMSSAEIDECSK